MKRLVVLALAGALAVPLLCGCPKKKAAVTGDQAASQKEMQQQQQQMVEKMKQKGKWK